jgi:hypothetical protein
MKTPIQLPPDLQQAAEMIAERERTLPQQVMQTIRFAREWNLPVEQTLREHYSPPELQSVFGPPRLVSPQPAAAPR